MNTTTASSWSQVLDALSGAIMGSLTSSLPDRWLNMTPMQMLPAIFHYMNWNPWRVFATLALLAAGHVWYFWDPLRRCGIATGKLMAFYTALTLTIMIVSWFIDLWAARAT